LMLMGGSSLYLPYDRPPTIGCEKDDGPPTMATLRNRPAGTVERVSRGDRATPEPKRICKSSISPKFTYHPVHNRRRAMWRLSNAQALIFVAAVACRAGERRPRWSHSLCTGSLGHEHRPLVPEARQGHPPWRATAAAARSSRGRASSTSSGSATASVRLMMSRL